MDSEFRCNLCSKSFTKSGFFHRHLKTQGHAAALLENPFFCEQCNLSLGSYQELVSHQNSDVHTSKELEKRLARKRKSDENRPSTSAAASTSDGGVNTQVSYENGINYFS